jgi:hypothetical protein
MRISECGMRNKAVRCPWSVVSCCGAFGAEFTVSPGLAEGNQAVNITRYSATGNGPRTTDSFLFRIPHSQIRI